MRVVFVANHFDVIVGESIDVRDVWIEPELRQGHWFTGDLEVGLLKVVTVKMRITECVNEGTRLEAADLSHHLGEQRIGGNIERDAKENICAALIELTVEFSVSHVELEKGMAGHQGHFIKFTYVPSRDNNSTAVWIVLDHVNGLLDLIDDASVL